jgi:PadR family transcriptional regulator PadR
VSGGVADLKLSPRMAQIIRVFLEDPLKERYGFDLMHATGLPSGTVYPALAKLQAAGWLTVGREDIDPRVEGRPARRFYRISAAVVPTARWQLAELSARYRPPAVVAPRLAGEGGAL